MAARAARLASGKDVLEVACGPGIGLGYLQRRAARVVGGDYVIHFSVDPVAPRTAEFERLEPLGSLTQHFYFSFGWRRITFVHHF